MTTTADVGATSRGPGPALLSTRLMTRSLGALYICGALVAHAYLLLPHPGIRNGVATTMATLALLIGAVFASGVADRIPRWSFHVVIAVIQLVVTVAYVAQQEPLSDARLFYLWATPFAAALFTRPTATAHVVWTNVCFSVALRLMPGDPLVDLRLLIMTSATLVAVAVLVSTLAEAMRRGQARLARQAEQDLLSGLPNRRALDRHLAECVRELGVASAGRLHLALIDLDHFKHVNDTFGHHAGDELIRYVSVRLRDTVGADTFVARMGGDEFAVVVREPAPGPPGAGGDALGRLLDALVTDLSGDVTLSAGRVFSSVSIGCASTGGEARPEEDLLRHADVALYRAKADGRRRWRTFDDTLREEVERTTLLSNDLRHALADGELSLVHQPVVHGVTGQVHGVEVLLRWDSASWGPVGPAEFVPVAEHTGLIVGIGGWVLEQAVAQWARWRADGVVDEQFYVAVNVSGRQVVTGFDQQVLAVLRRHGVPPHCLVIEVTETAVLSGEAATTEVMARLRAAGVRIALDDFGTGYSSLSHLLRLPVDTLKIDRSFVAGLGPEDGIERQVVSAVTGLAAGLGLDVVAEGVETPEQVAILGELGVCLLQGYLLGRPLPAEEVEPLLVRARGARAAVDLVSAPQVVSP